MLCRADVPDDLTIDARMLRSGASDDLNLLVKGLLKEPSTSACAQVKLWTVAVSM